MRIETEHAAQMLSQEISALEEQCLLCSREAGRLSAFDVGELQGAGAQALGARVRAQAMVARAHLAFCESLLVADRKNLALVHSLPTTSPGVLDTNEAELQVREARARRESLESQKELAMTRAYRSASQRSWAYPARALPRDESWHYFDSLICMQDDRIKRYERILEEAERYQYDAASLYGGVDTSGLDAATSSARAFAEQGIGIAGSWTMTAAFDASLAARSLDATLALSDKDLLYEFFAGNLAVKGALARADTSETFSLCGVPATGAAWGELVGGALCLVPYAKGKGDGEANMSSAGLGAKAEAGAHAAAGGTNVAVGPLTSKGEAKAFAGSMGISAGASLLTKGDPVPSLTAKAEAKGYVLGGEGSMRMAVPNFDHHVKARGEVLTAKSEATFVVGDEGAETKLGAEAYVATGEILGGITFWGVKVDLSLEAKVGGAGGAVGVAAKPTSIEGEIAAGLGLGVGAKLKVDWSGTFDVLKRAHDDFTMWWNEIGKRG